MLDVLRSTSSSCDGNVCVFAYGLRLQLAIFGYPSDVSDSSLLGGLSFKHYSTSLFRPFDLHGLSCASLRPNR
jgi:hypothetical protein